ncbi:hypothetical protein F2P81_012621 [Scophthalmus maximus]|uniref:Uncharacterized protein n=1 Tax=Scophthalmus maximus TaxID=52904 RepID=A0A6A4SL96_SCOMX|nr:hypothetical protein F2P81_012621 [Scophthalmus maximus]
MTGDAHPQAGACSLSLITMDSRQTAGVRTGCRCASSECCVKHVAPDMMKHCRTGMECSPAKEQDIYKPCNKKM